ncbi:MAG: response regulator [Candidatus Latescibacterota bacterium]
MGRVLVVDPDPVQRRALARGLAVALEGQHRIEEEEDGRGAVARVSAGGVDVLVTEVHLPDVPGWVLLRRLHELDPELPVIAVTADESWETSRLVRVEGGPVFYYGLKPLDQAELGRVVDCALRWRCRRAGSGPPPNAREAASR